MWSESVGVRIVHKVFILRKRGNEGVVYLRTGGSAIGHLGIQEVYKKLGASVGKQVSTSVCVFGYGSDGTKCLMGSERLAEGPSLDESLENDGAFGGENRDDSVLFNDGCINEFCMEKNLEVIGEIVGVHFREPLGSV
ncbi:hypothetical protein Tco_0940703 [Tanacetum coccineum]|uniref:Uncharacterized protein n=1 Tax=Tanacetum coccineum TaxID=301880 RepID=A0ABQ5DPM7_9ASTR